MDRPILSNLTPAQLRQEFIDSPYPKWSSMCLLKSLGYRVLDAVLIVPDYPVEVAASLITEFAQLNDTDKVLVRSDGGRELGPYPQGGNTVEISRGIDDMARLQRAGRAVIVMQPTKRFANRLSANLHLISTGEFRVDILGPGFDLADLNRGQITPELSVETRSVSWTTYNPPSSALTTHSEGSLTDARANRLLRIGSELLPAIGVRPEGPPILFAETWLRENGFTELFDDNRPAYAFRQFCHMYDNAFEIGRTYSDRVGWNNLVIGVSNLGDGAGLVYWDIANPAEKFAFPSRQGVSKRS